MHGLPCSSLGCFGNSSDVSTDPIPPQETDSSRQSRNNHESHAEFPVVCQPETLPGIPQEQRRTASAVSKRSTRTNKVNGTSSNSTCGLQGEDDDDVCSELPPACHNVSLSSGDEDLDLECSPELQLKFPQIPRPSIIIRQPKVVSVHLFINVCCFLLKLNAFCFLTVMHEISTGGW